MECPKSHLGLLSAFSFLIREVNVGRFWIQRVSWNSNMLRYYEEMESRKLRMVGEFVRRENLRRILKSEEAW